MTDAKARLANRERQRKFRETHREEINKERKKRYNERIKKGKCPRCGGKAPKGYTLCSECCDYQAELNRKYAKKKKKNVAAKKATVKKSAVKKVATKKPAAKKTKVKPKTKKK